MMIAGLLQQQTKQDIDSVPGLVNLPVLGALFRSRDYLSGETELAIIVDALSGQSDLARQAADAGRRPGDRRRRRHRPAGQAEQASNVPPAAVAGKSLQGPYGYVIE